jgi:hypothetical protein
LCKHRYFLPYCYNHKGVKENDIKPYNNKKKIQLELENALQLAKLLETIHYTIKVPSILYHLLQNAFTTIGLCTKVTILPSIMDLEQFIRGSYFTKLKNRITLNHKLDLKNTICVTTIFLLNLN